MIGEAAAITVAEMVEDNPAGGTDAGRHLEQVDQVLCRQAAGEGLSHDARDRGQRAFDCLQRRTVTFHAQRDPRMVNMGATQEVVLD